MSDITERPLTDAEIEELERRKREGRPALDEELVRKYEPDRLRRIVLRSAGRGEFLELAERSEMERVLPGHDFSKVRIFRGPLADEITARHQADALTIANTGMILMREGPRSAAGTTTARALLAHELTHVAQAQRGMVFAKEGGGEGEHEQEAEAVEESVKQREPSSSDSDDGVAMPQQAKAEDATGDLPAETRRVEAKRTAIVRRVMEMMVEEGRWNRERAGEMVPNLPLITL